MIRLIKIKKKDILIRQLRSKDADKNYLNMIKMQIILYFQKMLQKILFYSESIYI